MLPSGRIFETNIKSRSSSNGIGMPVNLELQNQTKSNSLYISKLQFKIKIDSHKPTVHPM